MVCGLGNPPACSNPILFISSCNIKPGRTPRELVLENRARIPLLDRLQIRVLTLHIRAQMCSRASVQIGRVAAEFIRVRLVLGRENNGCGRKRRRRFAKNLGGRVRRVDVRNALGTFDTPWCPDFVLFCL
jgi:hypothetical protein